MNPYENQLIGAFVFALGQQHGRRFPAADASAFSLNLFQQTPLDRAYSDLIVGRDRCLVLEFKRTRAEVASERAKWSDAGLEAFRSDRVLLATAPLAHLVLYGCTDRDTVCLKACTYLDVLGLAPDVKLERFAPERLIKHLLDVEDGTARPIGLAPDALMRYLDFLWRARHAQGESTGGPAQGAWLGVAHGAGGLRIVAARSLGHLLGRGRGLTQELERRRTERKLDRDRDDERDMGLGR